MEVALGILLAVAVVAALVMGLQAGSARSNAARALGELEALRTRTSALEADAKRSHESLEEKRKAVEDLKDRLKDKKKRRQEERESSRFKQDLDQAREEIEREMERKLAKAREDAEVAKDAMKKLAAEVEALKSRRPAPVEPKAPVEKVEAKAEKAASSAEPAGPRGLNPEEKARLDKAEQELARAKGKIEQLEGEVRKARGRSETDRRVFVVQKGELEVAKDKFRSLESRLNAALLERDEMKKARWLLEKEMKKLLPTIEAEEKPAEAKAEETPVEAKAEQVPVEEPTESKGEAVA